MIEITILSPSLHGPHGAVARHLYAHFRAREDVDTYVFFTQGFDRASIAQGVNSILNGPCNILITLGACATITAAEMLVEAGRDKHVVHIATLIGTDFADINESNSRIFVRYIYRAHHTHGNLLFSAKPDLKQAVMPVVLYPGNPAWEFSLFDALEKDFSAHRRKLNSITEKSVFAFSEALLRLIHDYDAIILHEALASSMSLAYALPRDANYFMYVCSELAYQHGKLLFTGEVDSVKTGAAALGYESKYTVLSDAIIRLVIHMIEGNFAPQSYRIDPIEIPLQYAANPNAAVYQGLDPENVIRVCKEWGGVIYTDMSGAPSEYAERATRF